MEKFLSKGFLIYHLINSRQRDPPLPPPLHLRWKGSLICKVKKTRLSFIGNWILILIFLNWFRKFSSLFIGKTQKWKQKQKKKKTRKSQSGWKNRWKWDWKAGKFDLFIFGGKQKNFPFDKLKLKFAFRVCFCWCCLVIFG